MQHKTQIKWLRVRVCVRWRACECVYVWTLSYRSWSPIVMGACLSFDRQRAWRPSATNIAVQSPGCQQNNGSIPHDNTLNYLVCFLLLACLSHDKSVKYVTNQYALSLSLFHSLTQILKITIHPETCVMLYFVTCWCTENTNLATLLKIIPTFSALLHATHTYTHTKSTTNMQTVITGEVYVLGTFIKQSRYKKNDISIHSTSVTDFKYFMVSHMTLSFHSFFADWSLRACWSSDWGTVPVDWVLNISN